MSINKIAYFNILHKAEQKNALLVAVSKTKTISDIKELYDLGHRDFGENYVQELVEKQRQLPEDIRWHFIGHLQTNKVKLIVPFIHLIHSVDSLKLLLEINRQAKNSNKEINVLLQIFIAKEETKFGLDERELKEIMEQYSKNSIEHAHITGLMGMSSFTDNLQVVQKEFDLLKSIYDKYAQFRILSMGMSNDYEIALERGSSMIRVGSLIFGGRA
ncbi:MAG TPA: YggS family pyridoxal phosphate-dependent enzyme [Flavisolibacter sp.]|nr:YggS family pyridoxal phosphate-dependent enzyme [Flavisolibacter sp.]